ncbi:hypothetical protein [Luteimonas sp. 100069]|uniref:hypothetical protein n=1 Tax=Luteimonas sp. 100069 TaxID=2006109 RepID=UPI000F4F5F95|nr:hypothetical protein [Luteimonas sp. 100069]RPD88139.1 hypothetical protein EGK76_02925 [Luteimonas sp. 100069]
MTYDRNRLQNAQSTIIATPTTSAAAFDQLLSASMARGHSGKEDPRHELDNSRTGNTAPDDITGQVQRRIDKVRNKLDGGSVPDYLRRGLEMELHQLTTSALPYAQLQAEQLRQRKAR